MNSTQTIGPGRGPELAWLRPVPGVRRGDLPRLRPGLRRGWTAAGILLLTSAVVFGAGCHYREAARIPRAPTAMAPGAEPRVTVNPNIHGRVHYRWAFTNGPDGSRILRFTPGE